MKLVVLCVLVAACKTPWNGTVPPVVPRADPCGAGALTAEGTRTIHRVPYLQSARTDGVIVAWAGNPDPVQYVVVAKLDDRTPIARVAGRFPGFADAERDRRDEYVEDYDDSDEGGEVDDDVDEGTEAEDFYLLAADIDGLERGETYCYRLDTERGPLTEWAALTLAPPADDSRVDRFVVLGDSGNGSPAQLAIARRIAGQPMDALLFVGDIAYRSGTPDQIQTRFFDVYKELLQRVPVYSAIGNHEVRSQGGRPFEEAFVFPGNERWYSFDLGDVHFVVLDTTRIGRDQATWLEQDLARASRRFTVVLGHHPPYTTSRRGHSHGFRRWFVPILERHHVELVITGHEHHYERSHRLDGIHYIVSGGGGGRLTAVGSNDHMRVSRSVHHFLTLEARRDTLVVRAIDIDGKSFDELAIADR